MHNAEARRLDGVARRKRFFEENDISDVENQIRFISQAELRAVRPVNKEAAHILYALGEDRHSPARLAYGVRGLHAISTYIESAKKSEHRYHPVPAATQGRG